jgi:malonate decarboxylase gamma subunit
LRVYFLTSPKLSIDILKAKAEATPVFANLAQTGAIHAVWDADRSLADQLVALLAEPPAHDTRDRLGADRGGRLKAVAIAQRVVTLASASHG